MPAYRCLCCERQQEFDSAEEAFKSGWDVAPYFTIEPLCDECPSAYVAIYGIAEARRRHHGQLEEN